MQPPALSSVEDQHADAARAQLRGATTVVIKVGSNVLVGGSAGGEINRRVFTSLVESIASLAVMPDRRILLVSSGAIAVGRRMMRQARSTANPDPASRLHALAAIGQPRLMHLYAEEFGFYGMKVAQVLLTSEDVNDRERFLSGRATLRDLCEIGGVLPIINENDTVTNDELRFGDNDALAAMVTGVIGADLLIILSDVAALYDRNPSRDPNARPIPLAYADDPRVLEIAEPTGASNVGTGGMASKVRAARVAASHGVPTVIAPGREPGILGRILSGEEIGTLIVPRTEPLTARKAWLRFGTRPVGVVRVDEGASRAVTRRGTSLLPSGIVAVDGVFRAGSPVSIVDAEGMEIARGLSAYSSEALRAILGLQSDQILPVLGYYNGDAALHRDDLVLVEDIPQAER